MSQTESAALESATQPTPSNGKADSETSVPVDKRLYVVDEDRTELPMLLKDSVLVTHFFKRAQEASLIELSKAVVRKTQAKRRGVEKFTFEENSAYAGHFFEIIAESHVQDWPISKEVVPQKLSPEEIAKLTLEHRAAAVKRLYDLDVEVVTSAGGRKFGFLFESDAEMTIRCALGDRDHPSFLILMTWTRPEPGQRTSYRLNSSETEIDRREKRTSTSTVMDISPGIRLFDACFGKVISGVGFKGPDQTVIPYDPSNNEHKKVFLSPETGFNPMFKDAVSDAVVESFERDQLDSSGPSRN